MLDIQQLRTNLDFVAERLATRGYELDKGFIKLDDAERKLEQTTLQNLQARRNELSKLIGQGKAKGDDVSVLMEEAASIAAQIPEKEQTYSLAQKRRNERFALIPNVPHESVPVGKDETGNVEVLRWGTPRSIAAPRDHVDLGTALGGLDFEAGVKISGARFTVMKGQIARLHRALGQFMLCLLYTSPSPRD